MSRPHGSRLAIFRGDAAAKSRSEHGSTPHRRRDGTDAQGGVRRPRPCTGASRLAAVPGRRPCMHGARKADRRSPSRRRTTYLLQEGVRHLLRQLLRLRLPSPELAPLHHRWSPPHLPVVGGLTSPSVAPLHPPGTRKKGRKGWGWARCFGGSGRLSSRCVSAGPPRWWAALPRRRRQTEDQAAGGLGAAAADE
jgi:hypothetical protein